MIFLPFGNDFGYSVIVVRQNNVDAHIEEFLCFLGIVRPKNVTDDAVGVGFIYHFLIEIGLEELNLLTAVFYRSVNDLPSSATGTAASFNMWLFSL